MIDYYIIWFMIYSFFGWIWESGLRSITHKRWYNSGFLNGPYIPVYGFGAILDIYLLSGLNDPLLIFFLGAVIDCALEYLKSCLMEVLFHARWWDYSEKPLNLNGRVYFGGFVVFGLFSALIVLYLHPLLKAYTTDLMNSVQLRSLSAMAILIITLDTAITVSSMRDFEEKVEQFALALGEARDTLKEKLPDLPYSNQVHRLREHFNFQQRRLLDAFPDLRFRNVKYTSTEIKAMVIVHTRELFHKKSETDRP